MTIREIIEKLQSLPENRKKTILWSVVVILGIIMAFFWINSAINRLSKIGESNMSIDFPSIEMPEIPDIQMPTNNSAEINVWLDADGFNIENKSFYAKNLGTNETVKIVASDDTQIYRQTGGEDGEITKESHDFNWLYSTLKNWTGPAWWFTVIGEGQEDGTILAKEIYYQTQ